jgi:hypothetical protein
MNENPTPATDMRPNQPALPLTEPKYKRVGGWLLFFCLSLTVFSPLLSIVMLALSYNEAVRLADQFPGLLTITAVDTFLTLGMMAFSLYAGVSLWRVKPGAVQTAKRCLLCFLAYTVVASILPFLAGLPSEVNEVLIAEVFKDAARTFIYVGIWYSYLNKSVRVKATFNS